MGKARQIIIDTRTFSKATDAMGYFSDMLNRYSKDQTVNPDDHADLAALLKRHDEYLEKLGPGINRFEVSNAPDGYPGKCFWIVRLDGSRCDFSFKHCLERKSGE